MRFPATVLLVLSLATVPGALLLAAATDRRRAAGWLLLAAGVPLAALGLALASRHGFLDLRLATISWRMFLTSFHALAPLGLVAAGSAAALAATGLLRRRQPLVTTALVVVALTACWFAASQLAGIVQAARHVGGAALSVQPVVTILTLAGTAILAFAVILRRRADQAWTANPPARTDLPAGDVPDRRRIGLRVTAAGCLVAAVVVGVIGWRAFATRLVLAEAFPDQALAACVANTMGAGGPDAKVSERDLGKVLTLACEGPGSTGDNAITDLTGLERLPNLAVLNLSHNQVSDLGPIAGHDKLATLKLTNNQVSDLSALTSLPVLSDLGLSGNRISDLAPLSQLPALRDLGVAENSITDIAPLSRVTGLATLDASRNAVTDVVPLTGLHQLDRLTLSDNEIRDLQPLSQLPALTVLDVSGNQVITATDGFPALRELWLGHNPVQDVTALTRLPALTGVDLHDVDSGRVRGIDELREQGVYVGGLA